MNLLELVATLTLDTHEYDERMRSVSHQAGNFETTAEKSFMNVSKAFTAVGGVITAGATAGVHAAAEFESAFTGVTKTVNTDMYATQEEVDAFFGNLREGLLELSERLPVSAEEIAGVAEAAGQLGIENDNLLEFTEIMLGLGSATNLSSDEAAIAFARYQNIAGMAETDFGRLASVVVELGNNTAVTESEITKYMLELANLAQTTSMADADIAALGATLAASGARAESSRTAMQNFTNTVARAVANGGDNLELLAETAGMTADEFSKAWEEDALGAMIAFFDGLSGKEAVDAINLFEDLGIKQMRQQDILMRLANNVDGLRNSTKMANEEWEESNALTDEVAKRNETLESRWTMFTNSVKELAISVGDALIPTLKELLPTLQEVVSRAADYVKEHPEVVENIARTGVALLGIGTAIGTITKTIITIGQLIISLKTIGKVVGILAGGGGSTAVAGGAAAGGGLIGGLGAAIAALGPILAAVAAVVGVFAIGWHNNWFNCQETFNRVYEETGSRAEAFKAVIRDIAHQIVDWVKGIGDSIANWWDNTVTPWFSDILASVSEWWDNASLVAGEWLFNLFASIDQWLSDTRAAIGQWFSDTWASVSEWWDNAMLDVGEWLFNLFASIDQWLSDTRAAIGQWFSDTWASISEWWDNASLTIGEWLFNLFASIDKWFSDTWAAISEWWDNAMLSVGEWLFNLFGSIDQWFSDTWTSISEWWNNAITGIGEFFTNIYNTVVERMASIRDHIVSVVESIRDSLRSVRSAIEDAWSAVKDFASNAWSSVSNFFGGGRASGGWMSAGTSYLVGEEGPELVTASRNSYVHNAAETADILRSGTSINITIQGDVYDDEMSLRRKMRTAVVDILSEQVAYG